MFQEENILYIYGVEIIYSPMYGKREWKNRFKNKGNTSIVNCIVVFYVD